MEIDIWTVYLVGAVVAFGMAAVWSFLLDKQKPPTIKELVAKFVARALLIAFFISVVIGVVSLAIIEPGAAS